MKQIWKIAVALAIMIALLKPEPAQAGGEKALAFAGGLILGAVVADRMSDRSTEVRTVVVESRHRSHPSHRAHGFYEWRDVRVWVPGKWITTRDRCGHRYQIWESGHYVIRQERVWVSCHRPGRGPCDDRRYGGPPPRGRGTEMRVYEDSTLYARKR